MGPFNKIFAVKCRHEKGYVPIVFEKITPVLTCVRGVLCVDCGALKNIPLPFQQGGAPAKTDVAPAETPAGVHPMPNVTDQK